MKVKPNTNGKSVNLTLLLLTCEHKQLTQTHYLTRECGCGWNTSVTKQNTIYLNQIGTKILRSWGQ